MVNRGPSVGCRACRARHVRCDNTRPSCRKCMTRGKTCPGFEDVNGVVFKDLTQQVYEKQARRAKRADVGAYTTAAATLPVQLRHVNQEMASICFFFRQYVPFASRDPSPARTFIEHISPRYQLASSSSALRTAVSVIASKALHFYHDRQQTSPWHVRNELSAVQALQKAVTDPKECLQDDTLLAVLCLGLVDTLEGPASAQFRTRIHTDGALALIRRRGPHSFTSQVSRSLFAATRNNVLLQSLWFPEDSECRDLILELPDVKPQERSPLAGLHYILIRVLRLERQMLADDVETVNDRLCHQPQHTRADRAQVLRTELENWCQNLPLGWRFPVLPLPFESASRTMIDADYDLPEIVYVLAQWHCTSLIALKLAYAAIGQADAGHEASRALKLNEILNHTQKLVESLISRILPILEQFNQVEVISAGLVVAAPSMMSGHAKTAEGGYSHSFHLRHLYLPNILSWTLVTLAEPMDGAEGFGVPTSALKHLLSLRQAVAATRIDAERYRTNSSRHSSEESSSFPD